MKSGKFIVIDGTDGSGKSTQTALLIKNLRLHGYRIKTIHFPQHGTPSGGPVDEYLNGKYGKSVGPYKASLLYAIDRFDASFTIRHWLKEGYIVIADRYVTSNAGHQGGKIPNARARKNYFAWLLDIEYRLLELPKPDMNLILHVPATIAFGLISGHHQKELQHLKGKKRDIHEGDLQHLKNAEKIYLEIIGLFPHTKLIECVEKNALLSQEKIQKKIWQNVVTIV